MSKTVWLKWDGVYDPAGICNQPLIPLNAEANPLEAVDQMKAIKQRLNLLGFNCGKLDNSLNVETKRALFTFAGYSDHPSIGYSIKFPSGSMEAIRNPHGITNNPCPSCEKTLELPFEWCRDHQAKASELPPLAPTEFFDSQLIEKLKELEDDWGQNEYEDSSEEGFFVQRFLSRSHLDRWDSVDLSVNLATPLAVKIVTTPPRFLRFREYAAIELSIEGFKEIKGLLFRIYRNFDQQSDQFSVAEEKLVYQEILDLDAIKTLPDEGPPNGENNGEHHPAKAHILGEMIGGGMSGFFPNYIGKAFDTIHAPYRVVIWISNDETAFDEIKVEQQNEFSHPLHPSSTENHKHGNAGAHSSKELRELRFEREESLRNVEDLEVVADAVEPQFDEIETVHDSSNIHNQQAQEGAGIRKNWSDLIKRNVLINQEDFWTERNESGKNLIGETCPDHDLEFIERNRIKPEEFPVKFQNNPLPIYIELRSRLDNEGENFKFRELREVLHNVIRHLNTIHRRLCCGQWDHVDDGLKTRIRSYMDEIIMPAVSELLVNRCPYEQTMKFCNSFMFFFSFVVHKAVQSPELDFYEAFGLRLEDYYTSDSNVRNRRNHIDGNVSQAQSPIGADFGNSDEPSDFFVSSGPQRYEVVKDYLNNVRTRKYAEFKENHPNLGRRQRKPAKKRILEIGKIILVPSYNPLDVYFFDKIRAVPMFMVGMFDLQYLTADGIRQTPETFFEHDLFHVGRGDGTQQFETLFNRLCEVYEQNEGWNDPNVEFNLYQSWQLKINEIIEKIERMGVVGTDVFGLSKNDLPNGDMRFTMEFLYFFLLHEPLSGKGHPVVPENEAIIERIQNDLVQDIASKIKHDFFGDYSYRTLNHLNGIMRQINGHQNGVPAVPAVDIDGSEEEIDDFNEFL